MNTFDPNEGWQDASQQPQDPSAQSGPDPEESPQPEENSQQDYYCFDRQGGGYGRDYQWNFDDYDRSAQAVKPTGRRGRGMTMFLTLLMGVLVVALVTFAGIGVYTVVRGLAIDKQLPQKNPTLTTDVPGIEMNDVPQVPESTSEDGRLTAKEIYNKVAPSVVGVVQYQGDSNGNLQAVSQGTGIILTSDGYIVTNQHVIDGANAISVVLADDTVYDAQLVGEDVRTDLAVLKIEAKQQLSYAEFGNSDQMEIGDVVYAIGNPGGLEFAGSITNGIISATNRSVQVKSSSYVMKCIQTNAAINPGNSGGPLINEFGQVIGITSSKLSGVDYEGIGFAIPTATAQGIISDLIQHGHVTDRVKLGIVGRAISSNLAQESDIPAGILVEQVDESSNASGKILVGDIITHADGKEVQSFSDMWEILAQFKPGDEIRLTIYRYLADGERSQTLEVTVTLLEDTGETS